MAPFPFDAVLFDCDGVLVDSEPLVARVLSEMLTERGWPLTQQQAAEVFLGKSVQPGRPDRRTHRQTLHRGVAGRIPPAAQRGVAA